MSEYPGVFDGAVADLPERHRDEVLAAFAALEHSWQPVHESQLLALRDATLRRCLAELLHGLGRTLVPAGPNRWTSGYRDDVAAVLAAEGPAQPVSDRAVLVLVLIHSIAIPRSEGALDRDSWLSTHATPVEELLRYSQLPRGEVKAALARLRASGLVQLAPTRGHGPGTAAYLPGPQLQRLTPAARSRLQEELILAAAPDSPLAAAVRARRGRPAPDPHQHQHGPAHPGRQEET